MWSSACKDCPPIPTYTCLIFFEAPIRLFNFRIKRFTFDETSSGLTTKPRFTLPVNGSVSTPSTVTPPFRERVPIAPVIFELPISTATMYLSVSIYIVTFISFFLSGTNDLILKFQRNRIVHRPTGFTEYLFINQHQVIQFRFKILHRA